MARVVLLLPSRLRPSWRRRQRRNKRLREWAAEKALQFPPAGTPPDGGSPKPSVSTNTKVRGTRTQATGTKAVSNFYLPPGVRSEGVCTPTLLVRVNSYSGHGLSIDATATPGASGAPQGRAV